MHAFYDSVLYASFDVYICHKYKNSGMKFVLMSITVPKEEL